jgi:hypothetical protein
MAGARMGVACVRVTAEEALHPAGEARAVVAHQRERGAGFRGSPAGGRNDVGRLLREEREPLFQAPFVQQLGFAVEKLLDALLCVDAATRSWS